VSVYHVKQKYQDTREIKSTVIECLLPQWVLKILSNFEFGTRLATIFGTRL